MKKIFVTGIGTNIGKTVVSAILAEALKADYWKPIQSGDLDNTDTMKVRNLVSNHQTVCHPERFRLTQPLSPHASAEIDGISIKLEDFVLPRTDNDLIIEGAGGLMVPLNNQLLLADLILHFDAYTILVSQNYLGSINHTLLTFQELKRRNIKVWGIIFNGDHTPQTEKFILNYTQLPALLYIRTEEEITREVISKYAKDIADEQ